MAWIDVCPSCHGIIGRDCWNPQECAQITAQMQFEPVREGRPDEAEALRRAGYQRKMDITEALMGPHEWGYRDPVEGGFMPDHSPFVAAELISELRAQLAGSRHPSASDGEAISEGDIATEHKASPPPALEAGDLEWLRSVVGRAGGGAVAQSQAFYKHRDRILAALSPAPLQGDQLAKLREMADAPRDGTYVLARFKAELPADRLIKHYAGRWFVVRHGGRTVSDFDLGWSLPGVGGLLDLWLDGWLPLPEALSATGEE